MKHIPYRQNPTVIDTSKKARPPPGEITLVYMNCLIIKYYSQYQCACPGFSDRRILLLKKFFEEISKNLRRF